MDSYSHLIVRLRPTRVHKVFRVNFPLIDCKPMQSMSSALCVVFCLPVVDNPASKFPREFRGAAMRIFTGVLSALLAFTTFTLSQGMKSEVDQAAKTAAEATKSAATKTADVTKDAAVKTGD